MWIMECKDRSQEFKTHHDRTKLRPLMPRPIHHCTIKSGSVSEIPPIPHYWCLQNPNFPSWNQLPPPGNCLSDYGIKREMNTAPLVSSRWNPTPEQLQALEEMYRRGIRTPSAEQIQQIAAKLRRFGKVEGKNVFYWFQNHKARERQRKRRHEMELLAGKRNRHCETPADRRQSGLLSRRLSEVGHPKKLPTPSNSSTGSQCPASINIGAAPAAVVKELDNEVLQQQISIGAVKSTENTCWQLDLSSCLSPNNSVDNFAARKAPGQENSNPFVALNTGNLLHPLNDDFGRSDSGIEDNPTLQLFPVKGSDLSNAEEENHVRVSIIEMSKLAAPNKFFEFLPIKEF